MKKILIILCLVVLNINAKGQTIGAKLSNNVTSFPVTGFPKVFYSQFHPGIEFNYLKGIKSFKKSEFNLNGALNIFYHRFFQTGVRITGTLEYTIHLNSKFNLYFGLGGGYMHSFYGYSIFELNANGEYQKISGIKGRPQFTAHFSLGGSYLLSSKNNRDVRLLLECRPFIHGVFANAYVPVVPYNSIHTGVLFNLGKNKKNAAKNENK